MAADGDLARDNAGGGKGRPQRCVIVVEECAEGEETGLTLREEPYNSPCFCEDVPVGVCYVGEGMEREGIFYAVGEWDCPEGYSWMLVLELEDEVREVRV